MTYGWAILVVMVAVAGLAYFGVLSPDMFLPKRCSLPSGITCLDYEVGSTRVTLALKNNFGETITINKIDVAERNGNSCSDNESLLLKNNEKAVFTVLGCSNGDMGARFDGDINITYTVEDHLSHLMQGNIRAKIVLEDFVTSAGVCQNAETNGLCSGLDIVYGEGYEAACCSEHALCC
jgi:hypothetical protein